MSSPFPLKLSGELGLRGIEALRVEIAAAIAGYDAIAIDTTAVESIDASAIQLLLAAQKTATTAGKALTLTAANGTPLAHTLLALGLVAADGRALVPETSTWTIKAAV
jgi:ABC-type transporter Mla MlaB component